MIACLGCCSVTLQEPELFLSGQEKQKQMSSLQKWEGNEEKRDILLINAVNVLLPCTVNRSVAAGLVALKPWCCVSPVCWWRLLRARQSCHHPPCVLWNVWTGSARGGCFSAMWNPCSEYSPPSPLPPSAPAISISPSNTVIQINNIN